MPIHPESGLAAVVPTTGAAALLGQVSARAGPRCCRHTPGVLPSGINVVGARLRWVVCTCSLLECRTEMVGALAYY